LSSEPNASTARLGADFEGKFGNSPSAAVSHALRVDAAAADTPSDGDVSDPGIVNEPTESATGPLLRANSTTDEATTPTARDRLGTAKITAAWRTLCFEITTTYPDSGFGEDFYMNHLPEPRTARGNVVYLWESSVSAPLNFALSDSGCTAVNIGTGTWGIRGFAKGWPGGRELQVRGPSGSSPKYWDGSISVSSATSQVFQLPIAGDPGNDELHVYQAAAFALKSYPGTGSGSVIMRTPKGCGSSGSTPCNSGGEVWIPTEVDHNKWVITHEVGHRIRLFGKSREGVSCCLLDRKEWRRSQGEEPLHASLA
jgi:hypothetical protein